MDALQDIFIAYAEYGKSKRQLSKHPQMDGRQLVKLVEQSKLISKKMNVNSVDLMFTKHKTKGKKFIDFVQFNRVLADIASARGQESQQVKDAIISAGKPQSIGTKAEKCKFYDDKSQYTGTWKDGKGGPDHCSKGPGHIQTNTNLDRSAADVREVKKPSPNMPKQKDVNGNDMTTGL